MNARNYPTELSESQWQLLQPLLPQAKSGPGKPGRPAVNLRQVINAIFYLNRGGCQWRLLPKEFGSWQTVYGYFRRWSKEGVWEQILDKLRVQERRRQGRADQPSAGCVDSQSVKTATQGEAVGYDGGKQVKGRKRHLLVDTLGIMLCVWVTAANLGDRDGLRHVLSGWLDKGMQRLRKLWVDSGYVGEELRQWAWGLKKSYKIDLEVTQKQGPGFQLVKRRWVVERTFSWLFNCRRNAKDYEVLTRHSEAMLQLSMISILLRRLA